MAPRPSFRKLLKTSNLKLENKQKNRQFKQQSSAKKYRKEQRKLRQAITNVSNKTPKPLECYKKKPVGEEEEEEEEFLESLPVDMMDEDDLEQIKAMAKKASFLTRDISSCAPAHAKKRKSEQPVEKYEKIPRKMQQEEEKELIHLLPIKDKRGLIPQTMEKPVVPKAEEEEEPVDQDELNKEEEEPESLPLLNAQEQFELRSQRLMEKKLRIASLSSTILADPHVNIKRLKELRSMLMETDPCIAVTVRKLVMVSLMEVFKDIVPSYRIRPLTEEEKATKVKKETMQLREFEEGLISQYKFYLEDLEQTVKDWKQKKEKKSQAVSLQSYKGLAEVAIRCICELMVALPHFNFHNNIIVMVVPLMSDPFRNVSDMCCEAISKLLKQDKLGHASLAVVKWKKAEEKLQKELLEAEASENKDKKIKLHTETLNIVFLTYFRILKKAQKSILLPSVLEGLAKFAHLINLEFFDDLLAVLYGLITSGDLTVRESLHCILTSFHILSGQGDVLTIDPLKFYNHLYKTLLTLHAGKISSVSLFCTCSDAWKQVTLQRAQGFLKRLSTLGLHLMPDSCVGILAANRTLIHTFPKCDILLDNEMQGSGVYLPELDVPEYCNPQNTSLWELHLLKFAVHLMRGAPSEGSGALSMELSRRAPVQLFEDYSVKDMNFNPPVAEPPSKKKEHFTIGDAFLDSELKAQIDAALQNESEETNLDFTSQQETWINVN
ncbi:hypothetical protein H4Q32_016890 [Labeo rohita]|uniref:Nucleolar complex protein 3 homolog n=1 Tax=Labeo rohita TaxID=84645 RepID=A0ABQ8M796_LABRO|nr:hypothetical protein H4Q32_016890 [Labeo rohita]